MRTDDESLNVWLSSVRGRIPAKDLQLVISGQVPPVWLEQVHLQGLPPDIPPRPDLTYADSWRGWDDFLGATGWDEWCRERAKAYLAGLH